MRHGLVVGLSCGVAVACAASSLPPYGEALFVVDTDLPVPSVINRLRVDSYTADGTWFDSADFSLPVAGSWPASFGVDSTSTGGATDVLVRLRAYSDLSVRQYLGERYQPPVTFQQAFVPQSLSELCGGAPTLPVGGTVTVRRGRDAYGSPFSGGECSSAMHGYTNAVGTAGAYVEITTAGSYCLSAIETNPPDDQVTLALRSSCQDETSGVDCEDGITDTNNFTFIAPQIVATLQPGRYFLAESSPNYTMAPADVVLAAVAGSCSGLPAPPALAADDIPSPTPYALTLEGGGTPTEEPEPTMTVDRLVKVSLQPGVVGTVNVTLGGACAGTMSKLGDGGVDFNAAATCLDAQNLAAPLALTPLAPNRTLPTTSVQGTFAPAHPCPTGGSNTSTVCIQGGTSVVGSSDGDNTSVPPRIAAVSTFWADTNEITVAQVRAALGKGLTFDRVTDIQTSAEVGNAPYCSWTTAPGPYEDLAVTCISWYGARSYCQFVGGDLPTEAQWEYMATGGGGFKTTFPWGYDGPVCGCSSGQTPCHAPIFGRNSVVLASADGTPDCPGDGPLPVSANVTPNGDTSLFGVYGLAGGVGEMMLDSFHGYASTCWLGAGVVDPKCWEPEAITRGIRGGSWAELIGTMLPVLRTAYPEPGNAAYSLWVGFRCAYDSAPP